jgi:hypothetical protein
MAPSPPVYVCLIVQEAADRLYGRDHEESDTRFVGPLFPPRRA